MDNEIEKALSELSEVNDISLNEILSNLLDGEKNLDLKTHIFRPKQLSSLFVLGSYLNNNGAKHTSGIISEFLQIYLRYMVSYNRLSRIEVIKAVSALKQKEDDTNPKNSK